MSQGGRRPLTYWLSTQKVARGRRYHRRSLCLDQALLVIEDTGTGTKQSINRRRCSLFLHNIKPPSFQNKSIPLTTENLTAILQGWHNSFSSPRYEYLILIVFTHCVRRGERRRPAPGPRRTTLVGFHVFCGGVVCTEATCGRCYTYDELAPHTSSAQPGSGTAQHTGVCHEQYPVNTRTLAGLTWLQTPSPPWLAATAVDQTPNSRFLDGVTDATRTRTKSGSC